MSAPLDPDHETSGVFYDRLSVIRLPGQTLLANAQISPMSFRVLEIELELTGEVIGRRTIGQPFNTKRDAEKEAQRLAARFEHANGYNSEHAYWWGRDPDPSRIYRYVVEAI
jgi:hypothetical protein